MTFYDYFRSSAAWRVRLALHMKGVPFEQRFVHLRKGEQRSADYLKLNPQGLVPTLIDGGTVLTQSLAIVEYLDETHPTPPLLPADPAGRARVRALALMVAADLHPINNLRVLQHLTGPMGQSVEARDAWYRHWIATGLSALEAAVAGSPATGTFCHGETPGLADLTLVPQLFNARRFGCPVEPYPTLLRIEAACQALPAFERALPRNQPDFEAAP
ncbi:MAG TPA: maleylacetoacetate isomerase [Alphaproteobacteria bacterium]|nr:maleylacetoacetate isomerase [Alphaproteobacteria bacterium]